MDRIGFDDLIPTLKLDLQPSFAELPTSLDWSDSPGFHVNAQTAQFTLDGESYVVEPDIDMTGAVHRFFMNHTKVCVSWTISIDTSTGEVWAKPTFSGYKICFAQDVQVDLQTFCRRLGLSRPRMIKILGRLVRVGNPDILPAQKAALRNIGVDSSFLGLWYPQRDLESLRHAMRRAFDL